jgi:DNA-binding CsgD family transcriptional regulator/tetratricopeptide (TPR) repeat protein
MDTSGEPSIHCPACASELGPEVRFCEDCGASIDPICSSCGALLVAGKRFCGACGTPAEPPARAAMAPADADTRLATAVAFRVHGEPGVDAGALWDGTRRHVDFYGGRTRLLGDSAMVAVFGATTALEDHATHAMTVALEAAKQPGLGVGLASGHVPVNETLWSPDTVGPIAAALAIAGAAGSREALAAASVTALVRADWRCGEELEEIAVGPEHQPVRRVLSVTSASVARIRTPFVGRSRQLDLLGDALALAGTGSGQVVGIMGEPGIGKSRLLDEFVRSIDAAEVRVLHGRCVPYGENRPYLPILDVVRGFFGLSGEDAPETSLAKVAGGLRGLGVQPEAAALIRHLLGLPHQGGDGDPIAALAPEAVRARTFAALQSLLTAAALDEPLLISVEDAHWIDDTSQRFLELLARGIGAARILLVTTYRPGGRTPWMELSHGTQIALARLGPADSLRVLGSVLPEEDIGEDLARALIARAEGNPFFLEELSLAAAGADEEMRVPDSVQGVLTARIDRLPEVARRLLQTAAVLGRSFPLDLLTEVWAGPGSPHEQLDRLVRDEFLLPARVDGAPGYEFKHVLTQLVAYGTLPERRRSALHEAAGLCLETRYAGRIDEAYALLADHWSRTDDDERAVGYLLRAAEGSARRYAHSEASAALAEAIRHAERLPEPERDRSVVELTVRLLGSLYFLGRMRESRTRLDAIAARVNRLADPNLVGQYHFWVAHTASHLGQPARAELAARRAVSEGERAGDRAAVGRALYIHCRQGWWTGRFREGLDHGEAAIPALEESGEYWWLGHCHFFIAHCLYSLGEFERALQAARRGGAIGDAVADPRLRSWAAWAEGLYEAARGNTGAGIASCARGVELSPDAPNTAWALGALGFARREHGDLEPAIRDLSDAIELAASTDHPGILGRFHGWLAGARLRTGDLDGARRSALESRTIGEACGCRWVMALAQRTLGQIALEDGDLRAARRGLADARGLLESLGARFDLALCEMSLARLAHREGRDPRPALEAAHRLLAEVQAPLHADRLRALGDEMGCPQHDPSGFARLTPREREVLGLLAGGLTNRGIAERLVISEATAIRHVANIYAKIGVSNRASAARAAVEHLPG